MRLSATGGGGLDPVGGGENQLYKWFERMKRLRFLQDLITFGHWNTFRAPLRRRGTTHGQERLPIVSNFSEEILDWAEDRQIFLTSASILFIAVNR